MMAPLAYVLCAMLLCLVKFGHSVKCVCNIDGSATVDVFPSPQSNSTIGYLQPHQCETYTGDTITINQNLVSVQLNNETGYVVNDTDLIRVRDCPEPSTINPSMMTATSPSTSGCTEQHVSHALTGNLTLCPQYVREGAKTHCHLLTQYGHNCYEMTRARVSWSHAKQLCTERGGHLVTIHNAHENSYIHHVLKKLNDTNRVWIGLQDRAREGHFQWVTGEKLSYTKWSTHALHHSHNEQDCAVMLPTGEWDDVLCGGDTLASEAASHKYAYICEYSKKFNNTFVLSRLLGKEILMKYYI